MPAVRHLCAIEPEPASRIGRWCDALAQACTAVEPWRMHAWGGDAAKCFGALSTRRIERSLRLDGPLAEGRVDADAAGADPAHRAWLRGRSIQRGATPGPTPAADAGIACRAMHRALRDEPTDAASRLAGLALVSLRVDDAGAAGRDVELVLLGPRAHATPFTDTVLRGAVLHDALRALAALAALAGPHLPAEARSVWADLVRMRRVCGAAGHDEAFVALAWHLFDDLLGGSGLPADPPYVPAAREAERHRLLRAALAAQDEMRLALPAALAGIAALPPAPGTALAGLPGTGPAPDSEDLEDGSPDPVSPLADAHRDALAVRFAVDAAAAAYAGLDPGEIERLARFGTWYERLADGRLLPGSDAQRSFVLAAKGRAEPASEHERLWRRYRTAVRRLAMVAPESTPVPVSTPAAVSTPASVPVSATRSLPARSSVPAPVPVTPNDPVPATAPAWAAAAEAATAVASATAAATAAPAAKAPYAPSPATDIDVGPPTIMMTEPLPAPGIERAPWTSPSTRMLVATLERATDEERLELTRALDGHESATVPMSPATLAEKIGIAGRSGLTTAVTLGGAAYLEMLRDGAEALGVDGVWWTSRTGPSGVDLASMDAPRGGVARQQPDRDAVAALYAWVDELETETLKAILAVLQRGLDPSQRAKFAHDVLMRARRHGVDLSDSISPAGTLTVVHLGGFATYTALSTALGIVASAVPGLGGYTLAASLLGAMLGPAGRTVLGETIVWRSFGPNARRIVRLVATAAMIRQGAAASASAAAGRRTVLPVPA